MRQPQRRRRGAVGGPFIPCGTRSHCRTGHAWPRAPRDGCCARASSHGNVHREQLGPTVASERDARVHRAYHHGSAAGCGERRLGTRSLSCRRRRGCPGGILRRALVPFRDPTHPVLRLCMRMYESVMAVSARRWPGYALLELGEFRARVDAQFGNGLHVLADLQIQIEAGLGELQTPLLKTACADCRRMGRARDGPRLGLYSEAKAISCPSVLMLGLARGRRSVSGLSRQSRGSGVDRTRGGAPCGLWRAG